MPAPIDVTDSPLPVLPPRSAVAHKGDFGRAILIGGSRNMSGAIALAGLSALRAGAGLVTLAVPQSIQPTVASHEPSLMTLGLPEDDSGQIDGAKALVGLKSAVENATVVAIGPGLGRSRRLTEFVVDIYQTFACAVVVDADGLNALSDELGVLERAAGPRVLTPHPGEFARLTKLPAPAPDDQGGRVRAAVTFAAAADPQRRTVIVLKGAGTVVADSGRFALNPTGNPGMATGGSGDVLTGIVSGFLCQGLAPFDAARLATYVHGRAGDLAVAELGQTALIASDLIRFLPHAIGE